MRPPFCFAFWFVDGATGVLAVRRYGVAPEGDSRVSQCFPRTYVRGYLMASLRDSQLGVRLGEWRVTLGGSVPAVQSER
jgi:hypothetical protein